MRHSGSGTTAKRLVADIAALGQAALATHPGSDRPTPWREPLVGLVAGACDVAKDLDQLDVLSLLGRIETHAATSETGAEQELAKLTQTLRSDVERRVEAEAEIEALLASERSLDIRASTAL